MRPFMSLAGAVNDVLTEKKAFFWREKKKSKLATIHSWDQSNPTMSIGQEENTAIINNL